MTQTNQGAARSQRTNSEAYDLYLRALVHVGLENRQDNQAAVELLEQAVARDPKFTPAYAALGREYRTKAFIVDPKGKQWEEKAFAAVENALSLDSELAEGYTSRGVTCSGLSPTITLMKKPCRTSSARWH